MKADREPYQLLLILILPRSSQTSINSHMFSDILRRYNSFIIGTFQFSTLLMYIVIYFGLFILMLGIKVPVGLFIPSILLGSAWGRLLGEIVSLTYPQPVMKIEWSWTKCAPSSIINYYICVFTLFHVLVIGNRHEIRCSRSWSYARGRCESNNLFGCGYNRSNRFTSFQSANYDYGLYYKVGRWFFYWSELYFSSCLMMFLISESTSIYFLFL